MERQLAGFQLINEKDELIIKIQMTTEKRKKGMEREIEYKETICYTMKAAYCYHCLMLSAAQCDHISRPIFLKTTK
jgi:hypothetical protein